MVLRPQLAGSDGYLTQLLPDQALIHQARQVATELLGSGVKFWSLRYVAVRFTVRMLTSVCLCAACECGVCLRAACGFMTETLRLMLEIKKPCRFPLL